MTFLNSLRVRQLKRKISFHLWSVRLICGNNRLPKVSTHVLNVRGVQIFPGVAAKTSFFVTFYPNLALHFDQAVKTGILLRTAYL
jgi:hypothetical protein